MPKRRKRYAGPTPSREHRERRMLGIRDAKTSRVRLPGRAVHTAHRIYGGHVNTGCGVWPDVKRVEWLPDDASLTCRSCLRKVEAVAA